MSTDLTTSFLRITNDIADFYDGMREYYSTRTLMQGYGEAAQDITQLVDEATQDSHPLLQSCAGSGLAVAKILAAIPIGIDHWVIETARSTVHHGVGAGFKTLIGTPVEGFVDGGKFVLNQAKNWVHGEIAPSTMGVADEVTTTLGTAALMFFGIKAIHTGGTGLINGLKNIEIPMPNTLVTTTGHVMPAAVGAEAFAGTGPMAEGLVFMAAAKGSSDGASSGGSGNPIDFKKIAEEAATDDAAFNTLKYFAKQGESVALGGLIELAKKDPQKSIAALKELAEGGLDSAVDGIAQILSENPTPPALDSLLELARSRGNLRAIEKIMELDLEVLKNPNLPPDHIVDDVSVYGNRRILTFPHNYRQRILEVRALGGDEQSLQALGELAKNGDPFSNDIFLRFFLKHGMELDIPTRLKALEIVKQLPNSRDIAFSMAKSWGYEVLPIEIGAPILDWLIDESLADPAIIEAMLSPRLIIGNRPNHNIATIYEAVDFRRLYHVAKYDRRFGYLLDFIQDRMKRNEASPAKIAELKNVLDGLEKTVKDIPPPPSENWFQRKWRDFFND